MVATVHDRSGVLVLWDWPRAPGARSSISTAVRAHSCASPTTRFFLVGLGSSVTAVDVIRGVELPLAPGLRGRVRGMAVDGGVVVACGARSAVHCWDLASGEPLWSLTLDAQVEALAMAAGRLVIAGDTHRSGGDRDLLEWFDARTGRKLGEASELRTRTMDFMPDGRLITGDYSGEIGLRDLTGAAAPISLGTLPDMASSLAVSPEGTQVAVLLDDQTVHLLPTGGGRAIALNTAGAVRAIAWVGATLAVGLEDGSVLSFSDRRDLIPLVDVGDEILGIAGSSAGLLAISSTDEVWLYEMTTGEKIAEIPSDVPVTSGLAFDDCGRTIVTGDTDGRLLAFNVEVERALYRDV